MCADRVGVPHHPVRVIKPADAKDSQSAIRCNSNQVQVWKVAGGMQDRQALFGSHGVCSKRCPVQGNQVIQFYNAAGRTQMKPIRQRNHLQGQQQGTGESQGSFGQHCKTMLL